MLSEVEIAYTALVNWETTGELPDHDTYLLACKELLGCENLAGRYRRLIDECESNENTRHSRPISSQHLNEDSAPDGSADYSRPYGNWNE